ncbi:MAG: hypothetical protein ABJQ69_03685 [Ekhidna sp.]
MAKIEDIINLDLSKIKVKPLKDSLVKFIDDYKAEKEKDLFIEAAQKSIDTLYQMVKKNSPEAIKGNRKQADQDPLYHAVFVAHSNLTQLVDDYQEGDLEGIISNTADGLKEVLETENLDQKKLALKVEQVIEPMLEFEKTIEKNQVLRHGDVLASDIPVRKNAMIIIDQLIKQLGVSANPKSGHTSKGKLSRDLVKTVVGELVDLAIDLKEIDEKIVSGTYLALEDALELEDSKFEKAVKKEASQMKHWVDELSTTEIRKQTVTSINKLLKALGKSIIETSEERKAKSQKVLEKVKEYDADIEACRAVIREFNKKKKESRPPKPKPTRLTKLKNHISAIIKLTPPAIEGDQRILEGNRKGSEMILNHFMPLWGMNQVKQAQSSMEKTLDQMEEKIEDKEQKELAQRWKHDLPNTEKIIAYEKKHNKHLLEAAALQIVDHIGEAIKYYKEDKSKAFQFLEQKLNQDQLTQYLPSYILEELKENKKANHHNK